MSAADRSPRIFDAADEEVARYRAISSLALAGLLAGLLSPLAMLSPMLWFIPLAAVALAALALWRIAARSPDLAGRPAALVALMLGTVFLVAAPTADQVYRWFVRRQAQEFARLWIDAVRHGEVLQAHQLTLDPKRRLPWQNLAGEPAPPGGQGAGDASDAEAQSLEKRLTGHYRGNDALRKTLKAFREEATMRTLFALGIDATFRYYQTIQQRREESSDLIQQIYAVTYADAQQRPKTFFITLFMQRLVDAESGRAGWKLIHVEGGVRPPGW